MLKLDKSRQKRTDSMNRTQIAIIDAFWKILEEKPYNKITVKDIVEYCDVNRNTFYYHFHDIPDLLDRVLKQNADQIIQNYRQFDDPIDCLEIMVQSILKRKNAFLHIYHSVDREIFIEELDRLTLYCVNEYANTVTAHLRVVSQDKDLLIKFYKCALVGIILDWLEQNMSYDLVTSCQHISDLFKGSAKKAYLKSTL